MVKSAEILTIYAYLPKFSRFFQMNLPKISRFYSMTWWDILQENGRWRIASVNVRVLPGLLFVYVKKRGRGGEKGAWRRLFGGNFS